HGEDRAQAAPPAAGTGELVRGRSVGVAAMLVMDVVIGAVIMVVMVVAVVMTVAMVVMAVVMVLTVVMRDHREGGRWRLRLKRAHEPAALGPDQPGAEGCDQGVACDLDHFLRPAHRLRGGVEQPGADPDHD